MNKRTHVVQRIRNRLRMRQRARSLLHRILRRADLLNVDWNDGLREELLAWENLLKEEGRHWVRSEYQARMNPELELQDDFKQMIHASPDMVVRILDVGAGPLTHLGKKWEGRTLQLFPVDPLAEEYKALLARLRINPPIPTEYGHGEKLLDQFKENYFDLACAHNSLDHSEDPLLAIQQMFAVIKPGGCVHLQHFPNEGLNEGYSGLHQWNFDIEHGDMILRNGKGIRYSLATEFKGKGVLECESKFQTFNTTQFKWAVGRLHKLPK